MNRADQIIIMHLVNAAPEKKWPVLSYWKDRL